MSSPQKLDETSLSTVAPTVVPNTTSLLTSRGMAPEQMSGSPAVVPEENS
jgi:hypothetical protein